MFQSIHWGIHPDYHKTGTAGKMIEPGRLPSKVIIPIRQHIGAPAVLTVKKGDTVKKGQILAVGEAVVSSNVHSSISGTVTEIRIAPHPVYGDCQSVFIDSDGLDQWADGILTERDWENLSAEETIEIIKQAGIIGMGGAAFPTHVKLMPPKEKKIDTLIINAAECEPFLTVDHRMMLEYTDKIAIGIRIVRKLLHLEQVIVGIEDNKKDAAKVMQTALSPFGVKVVLVPTKYPQGAEKMLIKTLVDRFVAPGRLPMDVGVLVQNVNTSVAICEAVTHGMPLIERVVTISGGAIKEPKNLRLRLGTTFADAIAMCGGYQCHPEKIIMGGPMMGIAQFTTEVPVIKGTSGILALSKKDVRSGSELACIKCGRCVSNCPMGLNPGMLSILGERSFIDEAREEYGLMNCIECGCCSYNCPAKRNVVHYVKYLKKLSAEQAAANKGK